MKYSAKMSTALIPDKFAFGVHIQAGRPATSVVQASGGDLWKFLGTILYPLLAVWRFISNFLFTSPPPSESAVRTVHQQDHSNPSNSNNVEQSR